MLSAITTNAQVSFGVKAGLNVSSINNLVPSSIGFDGDFTSSKVKLGGQIGMYAIIHFSKILDFQPEFLFSMKGFNYEDAYYEAPPPTPGATGNSIIEKSRLSLNYIEIPLLLRISPAKNFFILSGPYLGILAMASTTTTYSNGGSWTDLAYSFPFTGSKEFKSMDYGVALGLGFKAEKGFTMGLKYSQGLSSIFSTDAKMQNLNSVYQLCVGYEFHRSNNSK